MHASPHPCPPPPSGRGGWGGRGDACDPSPLPPPARRARGISGDSPEDVAEHLSPEACPEQRHNGEGILTIPERDIKDTRKPSGPCRTFETTSAGCEASGQCGESPGNRSSLGHRRPKFSGHKKILLCPRSSRGAR